MVHSFLRRPGDETKVGQARAQTKTKKETKKLHHINAKKYAKSRLVIYYTNF
jgi:hypothetical protein